MKKIIILFCLFLSSKIVHAQDPTVLFNQANEAYRQKKYDAALILYEKIVADGQLSANLYFNLANTYYRTNDVGKAILYYERAHRLSPRDSDLIFNLNYSKTHLDQNIQSSEKSILFKLTDFFARFYSKDECVAVSVGFAIFFSILWLIFFAVDIAVPTRSLTLLLGFFFFVLSITVFMAKDWGERNLAVVLKETKAHFEPRDDATVYFNLAEGTEVRLIEKETGWIKIKRLDGKLGWLKEETVEEI